MTTKITCLSLIFIALFAILFTDEAVSQVASTTIQIKENKELGPYLTDSKGMTLYYFKKDSPGKSVCTETCLEMWPAFDAKEISIPEKLNGKDFGTITREDGKKQSTYKGYPLYYYRGDSNPGDTTGQGVSNIWFVVNPYAFKS